MAKDFAARLAGESSLYASTNSEANIAAKRKCPGNLVRLSSYVVKELAKVADYVQPASASQAYSEWGIRFGVTPKLKPIGGLLRRLREHRS